MAFNIPFAAGSGVFIPSFMRGADSIPSGSSAGVIETITPPTGERVRLDWLVGNISNLLTTVKSDGATIISGELQTAPGDGQPTENRFNIQNIGTQTNTTNNAPGTKPAVLFATDAVVTIECSAVTPNTIYFSYSFGVIS